MRTRHVNIMGISYKGNVSKTVSGLTCQHWSSQYPHRHSLGKTEPSNYCRNVPEFERGPWCYTTSSSKRWDLCDVPMCSKSHSSLSFIITRQIIRSRIIASLLRSQKRKTLPQMKGRAGGSTKKKNNIGASYNLQNHQVLGHLWCTQVK